MLKKDPYELLGVAKDADAKDIKRAYRRLARLHHPDLNPDDDYAKERFIELSDAHDVLSDPTQRALFDEFGLPGLQEGFDPIIERQRRRRQSSWAKDDSPFESVFHNIHEDDPFRKSAFDDLTDYPRGADIHRNLTIDLMLAITGGAKSFAHNGDALAVRIPPNTKDGAHIVVPMEGEEALHFKGEPGDLILTIEVEPHGLLEREDNDLYLRLPITMTEAILGAKIPITTPQGAVVMTIPEGVHSGAKLRLKGMGIISEVGKGDFYVVPQIHSPERITDKIRDIAQSLDDGYVEDIRQNLKF